MLGENPGSRLLHTAALLELHNVAPMPYRKLPQLANTLSILPVDRLAKKFSADPIDADECQPVDTSSGCLR